MKIAYLLHWNDSFHSGVLKKVRTQTGFWQSMGHEVAVYLYSARTREQLQLPADEAFAHWHVFIYLSGRARLRAVTDAAATLLSWNPQLVYFRYDLYYPGMDQLLRAKPVVVEINTNDVTEFAGAGPLRSLYNRLTRHRILGKSQGLVFVSHELVDMPAFLRYRATESAVIGNGIDLREISPLPPAHNATPRLVFLGTAQQPWHGTEKILQMAAAFPNWTFDLVGMEASDLVSELPPNLTAYGRLREDQYGSLLAQADIAIGSLSMYTIGLGEGSPLKVREYLASGLPVIIGYQDTDFLQTAPFLLVLPNTSENVSDHLPCIEQFVLSWMGKRVPQDSVLHLDARTKEHARLEFFRRLLDSQGHPGGERSLQVSGGKSSVPSSVALVVTDLVFAGAENQVVTLAQSLKNRGWRVCVISLLPPEAHVQTLLKKGIPVDHLGMTRGIPDPRAIVRLWRILRAFQPDIVHSHMIHANLLTRVARLFTPMPVLLGTAHSVYEGGRARDWLYRITDRLSDLVTNVSQAGVDRYLQTGAARPGRIRFMPNGLEISAYTPNEQLRQQLRAELRSEDKFVWLAAGRLTPEKDFHTLLRAFAQLDWDSSPSGREAHLWIAGQGELRDALEAETKSLGIANRVQFLGLRKDMPALMNGMDGYVLSSRWEGMPMVLLEAATVSRPIVATRVGGVPEVIKDHETGLLVDAENPAQLADAMREVMQMSASERIKLGDRAKEVAGTQFAIENVTGKWIHLYEELWEGR